MVHDGQVSACVVGGGGWGGGGRVDSLKRLLYSFFSLGADVSQYTVSSLHGQIVRCRCTM